MKKKTLRLIAMIACAATLFTACASTPAGNDSGTVSGVDSVGGTTNPGEKVLRYYLPETPPTMNPHTTANNYELLLDMTATLYREIYDVETKMMVSAPCLADGEPIPKDDTHKVWTIKVGKGYTFTDGTVIDANTVEYSIKMMNDPKLANRNLNASYFENGVKYLEGNCEWLEVGFKAIDDYTLEVTFAENYEPESAKDVRELFMWIGTGIVHPEVYEASLNADGTECSYGSTLEKFVASALYTPTKLIQGQFLEITRRTDNASPLADVFTPDRVEYYCVSDANTAVQLFEQGKLDVVIANQTAYDEYPNAYYAYAADNMGLFINGETPKETALKDVNLRYALYWGLDRETLVKAVFPTSKPSAYQYLAFATMPDPADKENKTVVFRDTKEAKAIRMDGHEVDQLGYNPERAKEYFEKAYATNGNKKITVTAIYSDGNEVSKTWAEAIQSHYQTVFGIDKFEMVLQATPGAIIYEEISRAKMNFDMALTCGWYNVADKPWDNTNWVYTGPVTYSTQYCTIADDELSKEWDDLYYKCSLYDYKWDAQKKLEAAARLEEILFTDCSFIPAYNRGHRYFFSEKITPVMEEGDVDLLFCLMQSKFN